MRRKIMITSAATLFFLGIAQPGWAADNSGSSLLSNPLAVIMIILMALLLIIIGLLANVLAGTADFKRSEEKQKESAISKPVVMTIALLLLAGGVFAQDNAASSPAQAAVSNSIGGMSKTLFYTMSSVLFLELFVILALLVNIRFLVKNEKAKFAGAPVTGGRKVLTWWEKFNKFKSIEQEADIDLGHDYDGIRELDNRLPPWWLYGFYITIIFAGIYLWRFHVSHTGPSSREEYETSVAQAEVKIKEYLKQKGESVDENTVTLLTDPADLAAGKTMFVATCAACHKPTGGGDVGPNLTDDYWLHGADVKSVFKTIKYGINAMPQWQNSYSNKQIAQLVAYVASLHGTNPPGAKGPQGTLVQPQGAPAADSTATKTDSAQIKK